MGNSCRCILLHVRELSEDKRILECFSEELGRVAFVLNTNNQIIPDYFRLFTVSFQGRAGLKSLLKYEYLQSFQQFNPQKQVAALYFNELLFYLTKPEDPHELLLPLYLASLAKLENLDQVELIIRQFEFELLASSGFDINFEQDLLNKDFEAHYWYQFVPLKGFKRCKQNEKLGINGELINQLKSRRWSDSPNNRIIKYILTNQIQAILGGRELKSKMLWPSKIK